MALRRYYVLVGICALLSLAGECSKPDWLSRLEHSVDVAEPQLVAALDKLATDLPAAIDRLDKVSADRLRELDGTLRDAVDGLNYVLAQNGDRLDAALAARVQQLTQIASALAADVHGVALGLSTRITATVDVLLATTQQAAQHLLAELEVNLARVRGEGDRVVADAYSETHDVIIRVVGVSLLALAVIGAAIVFATQLRRRGAAALAVQAGLLSLVAAAGVTLLFSRSVRQRFVRVTPVVIDHTGCPRALADGSRFLAAIRNGVTPEAVGDASELLPRVSSCLIVGGSRELVDRATERLSAMRRALGIARPCLTNDECNAGTTCDIASGACVVRCDENRDCAAGLLCHTGQNRCGPPCTGVCPGGGRCTDGVCIDRIPPRIGGGRDWIRLRACSRDPACISIGGQLRLER